MEFFKIAQVLIDKKKARVMLQNADGKDKELKYSVRHSASIEKLQLILYICNKEGIKLLENSCFKMIDKDLESCTPDEWEEVHAKRKKEIIQTKIDKIKREEF